MADHGTVEYATAQGNDLPAHENTYDRFVHFAVVGTAHVINIVIGLAIGGANHRWGIGTFIIVIASLVATHGLMSKAQAPSYAMIVLALLTLAVTA